MARSIREVKYEYDLDDILDAHEALDIKEEAEAWSAYDAKIKAGI